MATAKHRPWNEMDHDTELLREEIVDATRTELRGPTDPDFAGGFMARDYAVTLSSCDSA